MTTYCKGNHFENAARGGVSRRVPKNCVPLGNKGHESHTFLYHIVHHYDELADWTVFTQAEAGKFGYSGEGSQSGHLVSGSSFYDYILAVGSGEESYVIP